MLSVYQSAFAKLLETQLGISSEILQDQITLAPENIEGDFAFPCFKTAKEVRKNPAELATDLAQQLNETLQALGEEVPLFSTFLAVGPYVNAMLTTDQLANTVLQAISHQASNFGRGTPTGKEILIEGRNINTHKAVHIGHMRNILVSEAVARIEKFAGNEVVRVCYPGDVGAHVAKRLRYYLNFTGQELPNESFTKRVGQLYTQATIKVDEHPDEYKAQIEALQKKLEDGDVALQRIWKETRRLCLADLEKILTELGSSNFDKRYFESEVEQAGIQIVQQMLAEGIAQYSQGAVAINLEAWKLDWFLLLKSTGASLYSTKDIALAYQKKADFPHYAMSLYVVGSEQEHHFQQLFKTLELIGFEYNKLHHLSYGLLDLKGEKMSSRAGNVILYEDFRDQMLEQAETMMKERSLLAEQKKPTARAVAFGAIKFRILLQDSEKKILFDREQALSFEGETGPYLQYTYARISSILRKAPTNSNGEAGVEQHYVLGAGKHAFSISEAEKKLLLHLAQFPNEVQKAAQTYKPNYIARFCLDLAQLFNSYYHHHKIIDETHLEQTHARLVLIQAVQQVLKNGLELLGIDTVESM